MFADFPGIGARQSKRFVYFLLSCDKAYLDELANLIISVKKRITQCPECFRYFEHDNHDHCERCEKLSIDRTTIMVVEKDADVDQVSASGAYNGLFFVFGGLVPIVEKETSNRIRINELQKRIARDIADNKLKEVILGFSLSREGDYTDTYVRDELRTLLENTSVRLSSLGRGLSTGTELEYSDSETLRNAFTNRH